MSTDEPEVDQEQLRALAVPEGVSPAAFRNVLLAYSTCYRRLGRIPSVKQVYDAWPRIPQASIGVIMLSQEFIDGAKLFGAEVDDLGGLTREQHMAIAALSDPFDRRSIQGKLKSIGVPMGRYLNWKKNQLFMEQLEYNSSGAYREALPEIRARLIEKAEAGDMKAIELVYAKSGEWDPAGRQAENAQQLVLMVVESVLRHVKDVSVRQAILEDVRAYGAATRQIGS